jgi:hypothetical protein
VITLINSIKIIFLNIVCKYKNIVFDEWTNHNTLHRVVKLGNIFVISIPCKTIRLSLRKMMIRFIVLTILTFLAILVGLVGSTKISWKRKLRPIISHAKYTIENSLLTFKKSRVNSRRLINHNNDQHFRANCFDGQKAHLGEFSLAIPIDGYCSKNSTTKNSQLFLCEGSKLWMIEDKFTENCAAIDHHNGISQVKHDMGVVGYSCELEVQRGINITISSNNNALKCDDPKAQSFPLPHGSCVNGMKGVCNSDHSIDISFSSSCDESAKAFATLHLNDENHCSSSLETIYHTQQNSQQRGEDYCGRGTKFSADKQMCIATHSGIMNACKSARGEWGFTCDGFIECDENFYNKPAAFTQCINSQCPGATHYFMYDTTASKYVMDNRWDVDPAYALEQLFKDPVGMGYVQCGCEFCPGQMALAWNPSYTVCQSLFGNSKSSTGGSQSSTGAGAV